jgi:hypothetical protein
MLFIFIVILIASEIDCLESENEIKKVLMTRTQIELSKLKIETASPKLIKMIQDAPKAEDK